MASAVETAIAALEDDSLTCVQFGQHFELTPNGLVVKGRPSFEDCEGLWDALLTMEKSVQFCIGDAWRYFEERFGERTSQIVSARTGWTLETLRNYRWVAEKVPAQNRRLDKLTFTHHARVAKCNPREQQRWLNKAADDDKIWSVKRLADAVKSGTDATPTIWVLVTYCDSEDARDALQHELEGRGFHCKASEKRGAHEPSSPRSPATDQRTHETAVPPSAE